MLKACLSPGFRRLPPVTALAFLSLASLASACEPRSDIVAHKIRIDAAMDAGCTKPGGCEDAAVDAGCTNPAGCDAGVDAAVDAGCEDDCGVPPDAGTCAAESCSSLSSHDTFCSSARPPSVIIGDNCPTAGHPSFQYAICTCADLVTNSSFSVDSLDAAAAPKSASIATNGELRLGTDSSIDGNVYVTGQYGSSGPPRVTGDVVTKSAPKCECDRTKLLDIPALISARSTDNDNASAQLTAASLDGFTGGRMLSLACGRYFFSRVAGSGDLQIEARGRVGLFVTGDVALDNGFTVTLQPGASLEIYVGRNVLVRGRLELSETNDGNRVLLAVQGDGTIDLADGFLDGSIYAPNEHIVTSASFELHGSLFVNRANFGAATRVRYAPLPASQSMCVR